MTYSDTTDCAPKGKSLKKGVQGVQEYKESMLFSTVERWGAKLLELHGLLVLLELLLYEISNSWKFRN
jgi:hypothetical protein